MRVKKICVFVGAFIFFLVISCLAFQPANVKAAGVDLSAATPITLGNTLNGVITEDERAQVYSFQISSAGRIAFEMESHMKYYSIMIYDFSGDKVWYTDSNHWNENLKYIKQTHAVDLTAGSYYLRVTGYERHNDSNAWGKSTGSYLLGTSFLSANETLAEPNNEFSQASVLNAEGTINGQIASNDEEDIFILTLKYAGRLTIDITSYMKYYSIKLYNSSGESIWYTDSNIWNENLKYRSDQYTIDLSAATYYLRVTGYEHHDDSRAWGSSTGNYVMKTSFTDALDCSGEPNNDFASAYTLSSDTVVLGQIAIDDRFDIYKFTLNKETDLGISVESYMNYYTLELYDSDGKRIWYDDNNERNENVTSLYDSVQVSLYAGTYFLKVSGYKYINNTNYRSTGEYMLHVKPLPSVRDASVGKIKSQSYKGAYIEPHVKVVYKKKTLKEGVDYTLSYENNYKIGKATVIITGVGNYAGTKRVFFKIVPATPKILKASNSAKRTGYLVWTEDYQVDGYETYYATKKSGKYKLRHRSMGSRYNALSMYKLQKGKTYYFKVRSYKEVDGKKYYSKFSKPKAIKIKK